MSMCNQDTNDHQHEKQAASRSSMFEGDQGFLMIAARRGSLGQFSEKVPVRWVKKIKKDKKGFAAT